MGRPTKFTPAVRRRILRAISVGLTNAKAARCAGISETVLYEWLKYGDEHPRSDYAKFAEQLHRARAHCEERLADLLIRKHAPVSERAVIAALERRFHEDWGRKDNLEVSGADGGPIKVDADPLGTLAKLLDTVSRRRTEGSDDDQADDVEDEDGEDVSS